MMGLREAEGLEGGRAGSAARDARMEGILGLRER
jgi:hypothetical protein